MLKDLEIWSRGREEDRVEEDRKVELDFQQEEMWRRTWGAGI